VYIFEIQLYETKIYKLLGKTALKPTSAAKLSKLF